MHILTKGAPQGFGGLVGDPEIAFHGFLPGRHVRPLALLDVEASHTGGVVREHSRYHNSVVFHLAVLRWEEG